MDQPRDPGKEAREWFLSALEVGGSEALGGDVRLEVDRQTTVLVGRNGAGKSALLERILAGAWGAVGTVTSTQPDPLRFAAEIRRRHAPAETVRYECTWQRAASPEFPEDLPPGSLPDEGGEHDGARGMGFVEIEETCQVLGDGILWRLVGGVLHREDGTTEQVPQGFGLLSWLGASSRKPFDFHPMIGILRHVLWVPDIIRAGVPRAYTDRTAAILPFPGHHRGSKSMERRYGHISASIRRLVLTIAHWHERQRAYFDELVELGRRVRIFSDVEVMLLANPEHSADPRAPRQLAAVSIDGINLGLLSDGTLRVLEILAALVSHAPSFLCIEEPEIAVHPGLLARVLAEIDAYSADRQIILSTQSPEVVSWARPDALRFVERKGGATTVRSLNQEERARIDRYLDDEGTLGDYVYAGGIDG